MAPSTAELYTPWRECNGSNSALSCFAENSGNFAENFGKLAGNSGIPTKTKVKKTNNQASLGGSILKANIMMEVDAAIELAHDLDQSGMHCVRLHRV